MARYSPHADPEVKRLRIAGGFWLAVAGIFLVRLFIIQVLEHSEYVRQAGVSHNISQTIKAKRGQIYTRDARDGQQAVYPVALNRDQMVLISDNRKIVDGDRVAGIVATAASLSSEDTDILKQKLSQKSRAYQILLKDVKPEIADALTAELSKQDIDGIYFDRVPARYYPENELLGQVTGFMGKNSAGEAIGQYGIEGYFNVRLGGTNGYIKTERDPFGAWIPVADRDFTESHDGDDVILTIDRTIQLQLCNALQKGILEYFARSATGIIEDPKTGRILAMCNVPNFDPNNYRDVVSASVYNNNAIFTAFEPGSVFKLVTMTAAMNTGAVSPDTTYVDAGFVKRDKFTIRNAGNKAWGKQTMASVIRESINTGTVFAADAMGQDAFRKYVNEFGLGQKTGIELKTEETGNIKSLSRPGSVYLATASFGQGLTTTPIQLLQVYATIANGGVMMKPTIVYAWNKDNGTTDYNDPTTIRQVITKQTAAKATEMMRTVVEESHGHAAKVAGYTIVGKTGTAQIAGPGGKYTEEMNHTFIGYGPANNPRFVMLIKYEAPKAVYAESTAVPTFGEVAKFLVEYLGIQPDKPGFN
ncbi:MAG: penicillin-binding protein 2 [Candidatus Magasanikbacteria bacterium]|nr:penicillin-binding protein 2 [Candidatus Magasanikbacteria bacterium]